MTTTKITIKATINASLEKVWNSWTNPAYIVKWNNASDDWHTPRAENDLRVGGKFLLRMEAKDGSMGFDFIGQYSKVDLHKQIAYTLEDGRKVETYFSSSSGTTNITTHFEAETMNPLEMQQAGWQAILNNFKKYVESQNDYGGASH